LKTELDWEQTLFNLILHSGNARSKAKEAAELAGEDDWQAAEAAFKEANDEQLKAHEINADIIRMEAGGETVPFSVLLMHSMDLLLLAWSEIDYTENHMKLCRRVKDLEMEVERLKDVIARRA
jgi:PTS system cellobiose-specific IIA component